MPKHYLIAILDWGLGHASRCVSLIRKWQSEGIAVTIASSGKALPFLKKELDQVDFLELPSYRIRYETRNMVWNMATQAPQIARVVLGEKRLLRQFLTKNKVDRIVSDGRFGCFSDQVESIWLAHQLQIQHDNSWLKWTANSLYHRWVKRHFQQVWVPDYAGNQRLAGQLTNEIKNIPHHYLGPLSRFSLKELQHKDAEYDVLVLLSGPEPQRTVLEEQLLTLLPKIGKRCLLIRGVPGSTDIQKRINGLEVVDWLLGKALLEKIERSHRIVCRSGYSTLMDLHYWQKPALLIPTPGQTEQEYLAQYWQKKGWATTVSQANLSLENLSE